MKVCTIQTHQQAIRSFPVASIVTNADKQQVRTLHRQQVLGQKMLFQDVWP